MGLFGHRSFVTVSAGGVCGRCKTDQANDKPSYELIEKQAIDVQTKNAIDLVIRGKMNADDKELPLAGRAALSSSIAWSNSAMTRCPSSRSATIPMLGRDSWLLKVTIRDNCAMTAGSLSLIAKQPTTTLWSPNGPLRTPELELINDVLDPTRLAVRCRCIQCGLMRSGMCPADAVVSLFTLDSFLSSDLKAN